MNEFFLRVFALFARRALRLKAFFVALPDLRVLWFSRERLFPNAESTENQAENVIIRSRARDFIQRPQRAVKIKQEHLVWNLITNGCYSFVQSVQTISNQRRVTRIGKKTALSP
jgi:hypothetical protein